MIHLVVVRPFGAHQVGDFIRGEEAERVVWSEHAGHVVRIQPPEEN